MRWAGFAWTLLAAGLLTSRASGQKPRWVFDVPACRGSGVRFESRLAELLDTPERERLSGNVRITRRSGSFAVELSIELDGHALGSRRFETASCARATETAAVAAALAVYDGREPPPPSLASSAADIWARSPEPAPEPPAATTAKPSSAPARPWLEPRAGVFGMAELGALPKPAWGAGVALELGLGSRWSLGLWSAMTAEQARAVQAPAVVQLSELWISGRGCVAPWLGPRYRVDGCAGASLLRLHGRGEGFDANYSASLTTLAPTLGGSFTVRAPTRVEWRLELDAAVPLSRRRFLVDDIEVARAEAVVGALRLAALLRF